ncbi:MAG: metallophosphoesterase family protein [Candidatus Izemoplasmatales bacterium]|nr:metallophosphoesterase family protein [Candidatus Izemoplasmatales bacterium]
MNYYIADLHFGHENILKYDNRPFQNILKQDDYIIRNWNNEVKEDDDVYIIGDISFYKADLTIELLESLNGRKHLIVGNHDSSLIKKKKVRACFESIDEYKEIKDGDMHVILCHYPIPFFKNFQKKNYVHLYGHLHNRSYDDNMMNHMITSIEDLYQKQHNMLNVGCMHEYIDYTPITLKRAMMCIKNRRVSDKSARYISNMSQKEIEEFSESLSRSLNEYDHELDLDHIINEVIDEICE